MTWVILGGVVIGAGLGAATSAATGGDPGEGALFGAIGGGLTGGLGSLAGAGAGSAASSAGSSAFGGLGEAALTPAVSEAFSPAATLGSGSLLATPASTAGSLTSNIGSQFVQGIGSGISGSAGAAAPGGFLGALPEALTNTVKDMGTSTLLNTGASLVPSGGASLSNVDVQNYVENRNAQDNRAKQFSQNTWGRKLGEGYAEGGEVPLEDGQFILPADIVSALGNGSTKAGAHFLDQFFGLA